MINYRSLTDDELINHAEARLVEISRFASGVEGLWPEVLYRLARTCTHGTVESSRNGGPRELVLTVPRGPVC